MKNEDLAEARILSLAAPTLLPLLENRKRIALERMLGRFKAGEKDFLVEVSELNTLHDMEREIKLKSNWYAEKLKENGQ